MVQNPQFLINIRKNINANNPGYGKYYPKAVEKETITKWYFYTFAFHLRIFNLNLYCSLITFSYICKVIWHKNAYQQYY